MWLRGIADCCEHFTVPFITMGTVWCDFSLAIFMAPWKYFGIWFPWSFQGDFFKKIHLWECWSLFWFNNSRVVDSQLPRERLNCGCYKWKRTLTNVLYFSRFRTAEYVFPKPPPAHLVTKHMSSLTYILPLPKIWNKVLRLEFAMAHTLLSAL